MNTTETDEMTFLKRMESGTNREEIFYILFLEHVIMQQLQVLVSMEHCG